MSTVSPPFDLITADAMRAVEAAYFAAGGSSYQLMETAGSAVATHIATRFANCQRVLVLCGPGNNGGDGFVIARLLRERGCVVTCAALGEVGALQGDAAQAASAWGAPVADLTSVVPADHDLIVDALFGIGLTRALTGAAAATVTAANASGVPIIAVDIASGIASDSGKVLGTAIQATETVTFHRAKPGHLLEPGRAHTGHLHVADIGLSVSASPALFENVPAMWLTALPTLTTRSHKYTRGHAVVFAGGIEGVGASRLAARAALRIGAGLVTVAAPSEALLTHAARGPDALMVKRTDGEAGRASVLADRRRNALLIGPAFGLDADANEAVLQVLASDRACVLDADALTAFAESPNPLFTALAGSVAPRVLTPHAGEFARLFGGPTHSKLDATQAAARRAQAVVVHKGPDTVIASPDGRAAINSNGTPLLAIAGTGDVLAGMIAGLLAQGMPAFEAACAAVWLHADAAQAIGRPLIADDLIEAIPDALVRLSPAPRGSGPGR
jgi:hydroxyethylthiazole kinase-like uncharacterized protein yjeF